MPGMCCHLLTWPEIQTRKEWCQPCGLHQSPSVCCQWHNRSCWRLRELCSTQYHSQCIDHQWNPLCHSQRLYIPSPYPCHQVWKLSSPLVSSFQKVKHELAITDDLVLRDTRLVLPEPLHQQAIDLAHAGHQGIVRTTRLLREKVWFPKIDKLAEDTVKKCLACQACVASTQRPEPIESAVLPSEPWNEVSVDFLSGLPNNDYLLVVMDDYSRFPEVEIVGSTSAKTVIPKLDSIFACQGIPVVVKSDNGPPFNSDDFRNFVRHLGFTHRKVTPLWPQANGEVEHHGSIDENDPCRICWIKELETRTSPVSQAV